MRFRGRLVDIGCIQHFTRVLSTISKIVKECALRLTLTKMYFILCEGVANGGVSIWCEMAQAHFFSEYNLDGLSDEFNEIYLEVMPDTLVRCLKSAQNAKSVKIKLTKRHTACLTFEIELATLSNRSRIVTHDVPVKVIPQRRWDEFEEPQMPDFDVSLYMPQLKIVRNVVDRMKNLDHNLNILANRKGELVLKVDTNMAVIATYFRDLDQPPWGNKDSSCNESTNSDDTEYFSAIIDVKKFAQFLIGQQVNPLKVVCNIVDEKMAHFLLLHDDVTLQYFLPHISS